MSAERGAEEIDEEVVGMGGTESREETFAFAFPADPLQSKRVDPEFAEQAAALRVAGIPCGIWRPESGHIAFPAGETATGRTMVHRGWMLSADEYAAFEAAVRASDAIPLHPREAYHACHRIPGWYSLLRDLTPETAFFPVDADLVASLASLKWGSYFLKDHVKSLKTSLGSRITDPALAPRVAEEMRRFRGTVEGGFAVRRIEDFVDGSETRYFVRDGIAWTPDDAPAPEIVQTVVSRIRASRFYSVDIARRADGVLRVVELGDGQVSDLVGWRVEQFVRVWAAGVMHR